MAELTLEEIHLRQLAQDIAIAKLAGFLKAWLVANGQESIWDQLVEGASVDDFLPGGPNIALLPDTAIRAEISAEAFRLAVRLLDQGTPTSAPL